MPADRSVPAQTVIWRRIEDDLSFERAALVPRPDGFDLSGIILAACDDMPLRADYRIRCDAAWRTRTVEIDAVLGDQIRRLSLTADGEGNWRVDGKAAPELAGCLDVDLEYTPATNALPINRLGLAFGTEADVEAVWVRFPHLAVERSTQTYARLAEDTFVYRSGSFEAALQVDAAGLPIRYEGVWLRLAQGGVPRADRDQMESSDRVNLL